MKRIFAAMILIMGIVVSSLISYKVYAKGGNSSCIITVNIYSVDSAYSKFCSTYNSICGEDNTNVYGSGHGYKPNIFASAISGSGMDDCFAVTQKGGKSKWFTGNRNEWDYFDHQKASAGWYKFYWNKNMSSASPNVKYGASCSGTSKSYTFTFSDPSDVNLVIQSQGSLMGGIYYDMDCYNNTGKGKKKWKSTDWYRANGDFHYSSLYVENGLAFKQDSHSSMLQLVNNGKTKAGSVTVNVYISKTTMNIDLSGGSDIFNGALPTSDSATVQNNSANSPNKNGYADSYTTTNNFPQTEVTDETWKKIQLQVNDLIDTINIVSYLYYGIALLTSILMIIINIVKMAGAPSNPMVRTRLTLELGMSFVCLALLGGTFILVKLFISTCMG